MGFKKIIAPFDGVVIQRNIKEMTLMTQGITLLALLALASYPGEVQAWPHYGDKYQSQFREPDSCGLPLNSYDRQRGIDGRYWTVGRENDPLPKPLMEQLQLQGMAGEHVGSQRRGNSGEAAGGYTEGYGYVEGYGGGSSRGAGRGSRGGYDRELMKSPSSDAVIRLGQPGVGR
jgi:hypothetical protein